MSTMKLMVIMLVLPLTLLANTVSQTGRTWYVNAATGSDSNSGFSASAAKATIQAAVDASNDGDVILVAPGTYSPIETDNKAITVKSQAGAQRTIIDAAGVRRCVVLANGNDSRWASDRWRTRLIGFTLVGGRDTNFGRGEDGAAVCAGTIENCVIKNCVAERSIVFASELYGCLIVQNNAQSGYGVLMHGDARNCTIVGNTGRVAWDNGLKNCIAVNGGIYKSFGEPEGCHYCCLDSERAPEQGNFVADIKFIDAAKGDYRLAAGSPCIDAGNNSYVTAQSDLVGNIRIANGTVDIGCYEYGSSPLETTITNGVWTITQYDFNDRVYSIDDAMRAISDSSCWAKDPVTCRTDIVCFEDGNTLSSQCGMESKRFPGNLDGSVNYDYGTKTVGRIRISQAGTYTFCVGSDDGFRCMIKGDGVDTIFEYSGLRTLGINYKSIKFDQPGEYDVELWHFSYGGGVLFFAVANGILEEYDTSAFKLVGDPASGVTMVRDVTPPLPDICIITLDSNGGTCPTNSIVCNQGALYGTLPTPTRTGYTFTGWFTSASGGNEVTSATTATSNTTIYAQWRQSSFQITFDANGGEGGGG